jgi:hypothetical protein
MSPTIHSICKIKKCTKGIIAYGHILYKNKDITGAVPPKVADPIEWDSDNNL